MNDNALTRFTNSINKAAESKANENITEMCFGTVMEIEPLSILIDGKTILPAKYFWLGNWCKPVKMKMVGTLNMGDHEHTYKGETESVEAHDHDYGGTTEQAGNHGHLQQPHNHEVDIKSETMSIQGQTEEATALNIDNGTHEHEYEGTTKSNNKHGHDYSGTTDSANISKDFEENATENTMIFEIYPQLSINDRVLLFSFNKGQMYYVAERID